MQQLYRRIPKNLRRVRHFCSYWYWEMSKQGYYVRKQVQSDTILYGCIVSEKVWDISIQFSRSVMSNSWWAHELQHARLPCPSPTPGACSNACPSSRWSHPTISSSIIPFSSGLQSFPASGSFPMSQVLRIGWPKYCSFSFRISPSNEYSGLILNWFDLHALLGTL